MLKKKVRSIKTLRKKKVESVKKVVYIMIKTRDTVTMRRDQYLQ